MTSMACTPFIWNVGQLATARIYGVGAWAEAVGVPAGRT
jgi:hypothetical protein